MEEYDFEYINDRLKFYLSRDRYIHCLNVGSTAMELAKNYNEDEKSAYLAGVLHDLAKEMTFEQQFEIIQNEDFNSIGFNNRNYRVYHGWVASIYARDVFKIKDQKILDAIRYHTTGRKNMSVFEKIVFVADCICPGRKYDSIEYFRKVAYVNMDIIIVDKLINCIEKCLRKHHVLAQDTIEAYNDLVVKINC